MGVWIETDGRTLKEYPVIVTPCVGVWIETHESAHICDNVPVTPCVGVWIETLHCVIGGRPHRSHPAWVCGLKQFFGSQIFPDGMSHPAWVCGLKPACSHRERMWSVSHPAWVCGLKHYPVNQQRRRKGHTLRGCVD